MNHKTTSLYIGRFQPFHLGHLDAIKQIFEAGETELLLIGIGSAEESHTPDNPFTAGERFEIIADALEEAGIPREKYFICPIRNINNYALWPHHVVRLIPPLSRVYSGSPLVRELFSYIPNLEVKALTDRTNISATKVRKALQKNTDWESLVPKSVAKHLRNKEAEKRIQVTQKTSIS